MGELTRSFCAVQSAASPRSTSRRYSSELRAKQAEATRDKVVSAAVGLFAERGYAASTMPEIARRAGVSTETVQANGPKLALLREAINLVSFGGTTDTDVRATPSARRCSAPGRRPRPPSSRPRC